MKSVQDFLWQAMKFSVAREFLDPDYRSKIVPRSSLQLTDEAIREEEMIWLNNTIDDWVWYSPFRIYRHGNMMIFNEHEGNTSEFHGDYWVYVDAEREGGIVLALKSRQKERAALGIVDSDPRYMHMQDIVLHKLPVVQAAPGLNYDTLKLELETFKKIARKDFEEQYGPTFR